MSGEMDLVRRGGDLKLVLYLVLIGSLFRVSLSSTVGFIVEAIESC